MTKLGYLCFSVILFIMVSNSKSQLGVGFDGFVKFLNEMGELKVRLRNVQQTGSALIARAAALEAAILKMNRTMGNVIGTVTSAMDKTFLLKTRVQNISALVGTTKQNMTKLQKLSNHTTSSRRQLNNLAEEKNKVINNLRGKITSLQSTVGDLQNTTEFLQAERNTTDELYIEMANITDRVERMECDSGFGYQKSSFPYTATIRFQRPFSSTPNVLYGMTVLDRAMSSSYSKNKYINITQEYTDDMKLTMKIEKSSYISLRELEFNWMACYL